MLLIKAWKSSKSFAEKEFEVKLYNKSSAFMTMLMLSLSEVDGAIKLWSGKQDVIYFDRAQYYKIILILLIKVITVYMKFFEIDF